tara:strand:- start:2069 stop:2248 length:180 start_codon:yes stop_codon:yes gene_type:complete
VSKKVIAAFEIGISGCFFVTLRQPYSTDDGNARDDWLTCLLMISVFFPHILYRKEYFKK